ncbi:MAG: DNA polymerase I, partial [Comamonadaceae bacterium]
MHAQAASKKTLVLVDGSSYLYRAFHAMPDLRAVPGDPTSAATGAIRGMINMMQALRREIRADYAACVFDASGKTFRDDIYAEYKAQRAPMPDDLRSQIPAIHEVVRLLGWKIFDVPGVEADDVIGTLAVTAARQGVEVIVSSGDKDMSQLVDEHITIIDTMSGKKRDVAGVTAEFGVPPHLMVDYQTLVGDTVDNVPGVPKVGPKTAAKWLMEYGSLDALMARADEIKGVAGENLRNARDWLPTGRKLVTIRTDCDLVEHVTGLPDLGALATGVQDTTALKDFYERFGFKSLAKTLATSEVSPELIEEEVARQRKGSSGGDPST